MRFLQGSRWAGTESKVAWHGYRFKAKVWVGCLGFGVKGCRVFRFRTGVRISVFGFGFTGRASELGLKVLRFRVARFRVVRCRV